MAVLVIVINIVGLVSSGTVLVIVIIIVGLVWSVVVPGIVIIIVVWSVWVSFSEFQMSVFTFQVSAATELDRVFT